MATRIERAVILALFAVSALTMTPVNAEESQQVVASLSSTTSDATLDRAMDIIRESRAAQTRQIRRNNYKPTFDQRIVRSRHDANHVYILGGGSALPM